ncbi:DUF6048 family protein [Mesonia mobilis]|uniref:Uncharacterized protein n=1 Tax=Mesonia mobilis TaxID=369791 RepID=A0ABQ3BVE4_9FLAO|nr:DUF6048 family protein [Mesonia mobilis]MBQ0736841.1 hypothetical protein [Aquimarina celericrescens]GGZ59006.1 hypothetical protein GCM10008088_20760 [Mesonia mobilis]
MNKIHIYIFSISFSLFSALGFSQEEEKENPIDTIIAYKDKYGIRAGVDFVKLARSFVDDDYQGFEIMGDYRIYKTYYLAAEIGNENYTYTEPFIEANTQGSYIKIGGNYNFYDNWLGMQNELYAGLRYGFANYNHTLERYRVYTSDNYFQDDVREVYRDYDGLTTSWAEFQLGMKVEVLNNLFLSAHVQLKVAIGDTELDDFESLYIPGFHRTYQDSNIGVGWGYGLSYMIPITKKDRKQEVAN